MTRDEQQLHDHTQAMRQYQLAAGRNVIPAVENAAQLCEYFAIKACAEHDKEETL